MCLAEIRCAGSVHHSNRSVASVFAYLVLCRIYKTNKFPNNFFSSQTCFTSCFSNPAKIYRKKVSQSILWQILLVKNPPACDSIQLLIKVRVQLFIITELCSFLSLQVSVMRLERVEKENPR